MYNSASSLNTPHIAGSAQIYSEFLPTMISLTLRCCQKCKVWLRFFAEDAQNYLHSNEDNVKFHTVFSGTALSYATGFPRKRGVILNFEYLGEFDKDVKKCWLNCVLYLLMIERWNKG